MLYRTRTSMGTKYFGTRGTRAAEEGQGSETVSAHGVKLGLGFNLATI